MKNQKDSNLEILVTIQLVINVQSIFLEIYNQKHCAHISYNVAGTHPIETLYLFKFLMARHRHLGKE